MQRMSQTQVAYETQQQRKHNGETITSTPSRPQRALIHRLVSDVSVCACTCVLCGFALNARPIHYANGVFICLIKCLRRYSQHGRGLGVMHKFGFPSHQFMNGSLFSPSNASCNYFELSFASNISFETIAISFRLVRFLSAFTPRCANPKCDCRNAPRHHTHTHPIRQKFANTYSKIVSRVHFTAHTHTLHTDSIRRYDVNLNRLTLYQWRAQVAQVSDDNWLTFVALREE